jgi:hypothetical protein
MLLAHHLEARNATRYAFIMHRALSQSDRIISAERLVTLLATAPAAAMAAALVDVVATAAAITMPAARPATPAVVTVT